MDLFALFYVVSTLITWNPLTYHAVSFQSIIIRVRVSYLDQLSLTDRIQFVWVKLIITPFLYDTKMNPKHELSGLPYYFGILTTNAYYLLDYNLSPKSLDKLWVFVYVICQLTYFVAYYFFFIFLYYNLFALKLT